MKKEVGKSFPLRVCFGFFVKTHGRFHLKYSSEPNKTQVTHVTEWFNVCISMLILVRDMRDGDREIRMG